LRTILQTKINAHRMNKGLDCLQAVGHIFLMALWPPGNRKKQTPLRRLFCPCAFVRDVMVGGHFFGPVIFLMSPGKHIPRRAWFMRAQGGHRSASFGLPQVAGFSQSFPSGAPLPTSPAGGLPFPWPDRSLATHWPECIRWGPRASGCPPHENRGRLESPQADSRHRWPWAPRRRSLLRDSGYQPFGGMRPVAEGRGWVRTRFLPAYSFGSVNPDRAVFLGYPHPLPSLSRCPACGYYAFNGIECFDCGYRVSS